MIKEIVKDEKFLAVPSVDLLKEELYVVNDLIDTLNSKRDICVGMAANMIGYHKNAIVMIKDDGELLAMINPKIFDKKDSYKTKEGCLSLSGQRDCVRYKKIAVEYLDVNFKKKIKRFKDFEAEIIQHEVDHLFGIII